MHCGVDSCDMHPKHWNEIVLWTLHALRSARGMQSQPMFCIADGHTISSTHGNYSSLSVDIDTTSSDQHTHVKKDPDRPCRSQGGRCTPCNPSGEGVVRGHPLPPSLAEAASRSWRSWVVTRGVVDLPATLAIALWSPQKAWFCTSWFPRSPCPASRSSTPSSP